MTKVLIIEDAPDELDNFVDIFELEGCSVLRATTGEEGLEIFKKRIIS